MNQPHQQPPWGAQQPGWGTPPPPPPPKKNKAGKILGLGCAGIIGFFIVALTIGAIVGNDTSSKNDKPAAKSPTSSAKPKPTDHSKLDDAAKLACDDFAHGYKAAQTRSARIDLANKVNKWAQQSDTDGIADNAVVLARGSEGSAGAWQIGADSFAQACLDAGWKA